MRHWVLIVSVTLILGALPPSTAPSFAQTSGEKKEESPPIKGYGEAQKWFLHAAKQGHKNAQYMLGIIYYHGRGVKKNYLDARNWFELAAKQNHTEAQYMLGIIYYDGKGIPKDLGQAVKWFEKAAQKGDKEAQYMLGLTHYERVKGAGKSPKN
jgi:hypothetical protein